MIHSILSAKNVIGRRLIYNVTDNNVVRKQSISFIVYKNMKFSQVWPHHFICSSGTTKINCDPTNWNSKNI